LDFEMEIAEPINQLKIESLQLILISSSSIRLITLV